MANFFFRPAIPSVDNKGATAIGPFFFFKCFISYPTIRHHVNLMSRGLTPDRHQTSEMSFYVEISVGKIAMQFQLVRIRNDALGNAILVSFNYRIKGM